MGLTVTIVFPATLVHPFTVAVAEYIPEAAVVVFIIDGFCKEEVQLPGPVQL